MGRPAVGTLFFMLVHATGRVSALRQQPAAAAAAEWGCGPLPYDAPFETNCPQTPWLDDMVRDDVRPDKVFMDIGCNKGDDTIELLERWSPAGGPFEKSAWLKSYKNTVGYGHDIHACEWEWSEDGGKRVGNVSTDYVRAKFLPQEAAQSAVPGPTAICVEPSDANLQALEATAAALGYGKSDKGSLSIIHAAVTDEAAPGATAWFPDTSAGDEQGHLNRQRRQRSYVNLTTVDRLAADFPKVDILRIDTEGWDPKVITGAASTLARVRYLEFEVLRGKKDTPWIQTTLGSVIKSLSRKGFECYWAGNSGILISLEKCWVEGFERPAWANVVCVKQQDRWAPFLRKYAFHPQQASRSVA